MRPLLALTSCLTVTACQGHTSTEQDTAGTLPEDVCLAQRTLERPIGEVEWTTEVVTSARQPSSVTSWTDASRVEPLWEEEYSYDEWGRLIQKRTDADGDGTFDLRYEWAYTESQQVEVLSEYDGDATWRAVARVVDTYVHGILSRRERDDGADGSLDEAITWMYEGDRVVRAETRNVEHELSAVTSWFYGDPPPALDHTEELDSDLDGRADLSHSRRYDSRGRVVEVETTQGSMLSSVSYSWDGDLLLLDRRTSSSGDALYQTFYNDHELPTERYFERDDYADGVVDNWSTETWSWTCP